MTSGIVPSTLVLLRRGAWAAFGFSMIAWMHGYTLATFRVAREGHVLVRTPREAFPIGTVGVTSALSGVGLLLLLIGVALVPLYLIDGVVLTIVGGALHVRTVLAPVCAVSDRVGVFEAVERAWRAASREKALVRRVALAPILIAGAFVGNAVSPLVNLPELEVVNAFIATAAVFVAYLVHAALVVATWDALAGGRAQNVT